MAVVLDLHGSREGLLHQRATMMSDGPDWDWDLYVAGDYETSGKKPEYALQPWRFPRGDAWVTSLAWVYRENKQTVVRGGLFPTKAQTADFIEFCLDTGRIVVGWNLAYDFAIMIALGFERWVHQLRAFDGMLAWRHLEVEPEYEMSAPSKKSYSLKNAVREFLPQHANYEDGISYHGTDPDELANLHEYNIKDNVFAIKIAKILYERMKPRQRRAFWIEQSCLSMVASANFHGLRIDTFQSHDLSGKMKTIAAARLASLKPHGVTEAVIRSPMQLSKLMYEDWKLPIRKYNKGKVDKKTGIKKPDQPSTDKEVLHELAFDGHARAKELREYREALNLDTKFCTALIKSVHYNEDGCAHPQARVFGTYTGRMTYSSKQGKGVHGTFPIGWAIHQMKNDPDFREQVIAPEGYTIVEWDAAGQEFKWMAVASRDPTMLSLCMPGEDPHSYMTSRIYGLDYKQCLVWHQGEDKAFKPKRKMGKVGNLCIAKGEVVLTDRGPCSIELVRSDDLVWDGEAFVAHDGVSFSGERWVIDNDGVLATPSHQVLVAGTWTAHDEAQRMGWTIDRACTHRHALRIMGGLARRAVREMWRDLCSGALRLWRRAGSQPEVYGDGAVFTVQGLRCTPAASSGRRFDRDRRSDEAFAEACQRMVSALRQPEGSLMAKLRSAWDRVSVLISGGSRGVHQGYVAAFNLPQAGHRPQGQRWSLRAWKSALGYAKTEPRQSQIVETYDIVNCGPRTRYAINGRIVHNSLQYRTSAPKFRTVARVQHDIPMTVAEAQLIHRTYPNTYPGVPVYWQRQIAIVQTRGYAETFAGRRVKVVGDWGGPFKWNMGSTAINYPIQGTGGDQKYLAMQVLKDYLPSVMGRFMLDLHDGLYALVPDRYAMKAAREGKQLLDTLPYGAAWNFIPPVPMTFDCKMGKSWGRLKAVNF